MNEYLMKFKNLVDTLSYTGHSLSEVDQILQILSGLDSEYNPIMMTVTTKVEAYTVDEVTSLLLTVEKSLEKQANGDSFSANVASGGFRGNSNYRGNFNNQRDGFQKGGYTRNTNNTRGKHFTRGNKSRGRGGRYHGNFNRPQCQLCGRPGHVAMSCYYRFGQNFNGQSSGNTPTEQHQSTMSAFVASPELFSDPAWYADSGASNHCTAVPENLQCKTKFSSIDQVFVGNGTGLPISSISKTHFQLNNHSFYLRDILHTLLIIKNLLSVSSFTKDN